MKKVLIKSSECRLTFDEAKQFGTFDYDPATTKEKAEEFGISNYDTIEFLTTKRFHNIMKNHGYVVFIPNGRIKFESGLGKKSSSPAFGSVVIRIGREKDFNYKRIIQHIRI